MQSKFCTLASSSLAVAILAFTSYGQSASPSPPRAGYIRFWDMLPSANGAFEVRKVDPPASGGSMLSASAYQYSSYLEFPVGKYQLGVFKKGANTPIKVFSLDLKADNYFTILVSPQSIDMFDDTNDPKAASGTLTIRNFFPGSSVSVSSNLKMIVSSLAQGQSLQASGLPLEQIRVNLQAKLLNGKPAGSDLEIDFKHNTRATLLVIPDSYGRLRSRVMFDGKNL
jgi:hypothetical protein